jgi:hypothetical protein
MLDLKNVFGGGSYRLPDAVTVLRSPLQSLQNQQFQRALKKLDAVCVCAFSHLEQSSRLSTIVCLLQDEVAGCRLRQLRRNYCLLKTSRPETGLPSRSVPFTLTRRVLPSSDTFECDDRIGLPAFL